MIVAGCVLDIEDVSSADLRELSRKKSKKTLRAAGVWKPVSFKLALVCFIPACVDFISIFRYLYVYIFIAIFITRWLLKLKVNIYHSVLLNFNTFIRPGECLHFYWHIKINVNIVIVKHTML